MGASAIENIREALGRYVLLLLLLLLLRATCYVLPLHAIVSIELRHGAAYLVHRPLQLYPQSAPSSMDRFQLTSLTIALVHERPDLQLPSSFFQLPLLILKPELFSPLVPYLEVN